MRRFFQETYPSASTTKDSELDLGEGKPLAKNNERADILSPASAAEKNQPKTPDDLIKQVLSDNEVSALEKKQISNAIYQITQEENKIFDSKMNDTEKERELARLGELKKRLQESDNKKKEPKVDYLNVALTGDPQMDKLIISKQRGEITQAINDTVAKFTKGELTLDEANKTIAGFKALQEALNKKSSGGGGKKTKKLKITRMKAPAFGKRSVKKLKTKKVKLPRIKLSAPKKKSEKVELQYIPTL